MKISATVITRNEEKNIAACLESLQFVDEIIVVDSGSSDRTEEICRSHPKVRFFSNPWPGYGQQKNIAADYANNDWILNLDADERVTPELQKAIKDFDCNSFSVARIARENYFGDRWIKHCGWYPDYTHRLYNRRCSRFSERLVHETLEHDDRVVTLVGNLRHYTYADVSDYLRRMDSYSSLASRELYNSGKSAGPFSLLFKPAATFIKMYIIRKGFLEGSFGLVLSLLYAQYTFCKYIKLAELCRNEPRD